MSDLCGLCSLSRPVSSSHRSVTLALEVLEEAVRWLSS